MTSRKPIYTPHGNKVHSSKRGLPSPGTKIHHLLVDLILEGITAHQACKRHYCRSTGAFCGMIEHLENDYGYDIRTISQQADGRKRLHYQVVGRVTNQGYIDFIALNGAPTGANRP